MKSSECARRKHADQQHSRSQSRHFICRLQIETAHLVGENVSNRKIEKSPNDVDRRGREPLARRLGKWGLKRTPHYSADQVGNAVR